MVEATNRRQHATDGANWQLQTVRHLAKNVIACQSVA